MRILVSGILAVLLLNLSPTSQALAQDRSPPTIESILGWAYEYRTNPRPQDIPEAVHAMRRLGLFSQQEGGGFFIGFIAGVLAENPKQSDSLVAGMFPMPPKEQAVIVMSLAYSGLPNWKDLLTKYRDRMPERVPLIEEYLSGGAPTLAELSLEDGTHVVYTLWGYYVATGDQGAVARIIPALKWTRADSKGGLSFERIKSAVGWTDRPDLTEMTTGSTAKWTLASYAERDRNLIILYRMHEAYQPPEIADPLRDVLAAAEAFEAELIRKEELAILEEEERKAARSGSPLSRAGRVGSVALSAACVIAGATGHAEIAAPCVITGAIYSGTMNLLRNSP